MFQDLPFWQISFQVPNKTSAIFFSKENLLKQFLISYRSSQQEAQKCEVLECKSFKRYSRFRIRVFSTASLKHKILLVIYRDTMIRKNRNGTAGSPSSTSASIKQGPFCNNEAKLFSLFSSTIWENIPSWNSCVGFCLINKAKAARSGKVNAPPLFLVGLRCRLSTHKRKKRRTYGTWSSPFLNRLLLDTHSRSDSSRTFIHVSENFSTFPEKNFRKITLIEPMLYSNIRESTPFLTELTKCIFVVHCSQLNICKTS